jgi:UDP-N-acetylglucosamine 1-carboxyvinyltransferase
MGCKVSVGTDWAEVDARSTVLNPVNVTTLPFPGFPTDMQAPIMATLMSIPGNSFVQDTVYNDRFKHVPEFIRLGANIQVNGNTAILKGGMPLEGTDIVGTDLRATAAMVLAALIADGKSTIRHIYHLDRGYEDFENKMTKIGASVVRLEDDTNIEE